MSRFAHGVLTWAAVMVIAITSPIASAGRGMPVDVQLSISLDDSLTTQATLRLPAERALQTKLPALLIFGGFESAAQVLSLVRPRRPVALASFDYPFTAPRKLEFPGSLSALPEARQLFPRTVRGIRELVRVLRARPEIDPTRVYLVGASFGAPFAVAAAAELSGKITGLALVHGFGRVPETAEHVVMRSWGPRYGWAARPMAWSLTRFLWLYLGVTPPEDYAAKLDPSLRVLVISAEEDSFVPAESSESLWSAIARSPAGARAERQRIPGGHLMPGADAAIADLTSRIERWVAGVK